MKLERIRIIEAPKRPLLNGLELFFYEPYPLKKEIFPHCLIGVNGSGKSQLLELIAEIFLYLDAIYRKTNRKIVIDSPALFELEYEISVTRKPFQIQVEQKTLRGKAPLLSVALNKKNIKLSSVDDIEKYLPQKIVGYSSGQNETISFPFLSYYDEYANYTAKRAIDPSYQKEKDYDPRFYLMDYNTNNGVVLSNLVLNNTAKLKNILNVINIRGLKSFQLILQLNPMGAPQGGIKLTRELDKWIDQLRKSCTCSDFDPSTKKYVLDFYNNAATKDALKYFFKTALSLYTALYKIELLNNLLIPERIRRDVEKKRKDRDALIRMPEVPYLNRVLYYSEIKLKHSTKDIINYINLSDGEHQYINVFGTILMTDNENSIFLMDEPETHFNPKWRREFVNTLVEITKGRKQAYFLTSHSPFVVADSKKEFVFIFKRDKNKLEVIQPTNETYGSSFDYILKDAFDLDNTLSEKSYNDIMTLQKSTSVKNIKKGINEFGQSSEKFLLFKRIEELKKKMK
jgi:restriction system-associated AAA family ATPase